MNKRQLPGRKTMRLYDEMISQHIPEDIIKWTYVEPFGGTFSVSTYLPSIPKLSVYNDIHDYKFDEPIIADKIHHIDFEEVIKMYDSPTTLFYLDPPYISKEHLYEDMFIHHLKLRRLLEKIEGKFILSYESNTKIFNIYKNFNIYKYDGGYAPFRKELIITNF